MLPALYIMMTLLKIPSEFKVTKDPGHHLRSIFDNLKKLLIFMKGALTTIEGTTFHKMSKGTSLKMANSRTFIIVQFQKRNTVNIVGVHNKLW